MTLDSTTASQKTRLRCPCGEYLHAADAEELVRMAQAHLASEHPRLVGEYNREDILWMAF